MCLTRCNQFLNDWMNSYQLQKVIFKVIHLFEIMEKQENSDDSGFKQSELKNAKTAIHKSSYEAVKEIDENVNLLFSGALSSKLQKPEIEEANFYSGVDNELTSICEYLETIGRNSTEHTFYKQRGMPFETIKDYLKNKGKAVQILSSKFVASKLYKEPPKQESVAVQATEDVVFQDSIQDLQFNIEVLNGMVEKREAQNKTLLSQFRRISCKI